MMNILISNDDGVFAPGVIALARSLSEVANVVVVAPETERSGYASALSLCEPLYSRTLDSGFVAVNGTPSDCVYLALNALFSDTTFDCVVTGINSGANLGQDVFFSGTFGAALTAQAFGVPAIATSLVGASVKGYTEVSQFEMAANAVRELLGKPEVLEKLRQLPDHVLNVNIPDIEAPKGYVVTTLARQALAEPVKNFVDPRGREAFWLSLQKQYADAETKSSDEAPSQLDARQDIQLEEPVSEDGAHISEISDIKAGLTDEQAVCQGFVSLSPVKLHHVPTNVVNDFASIMSTSMTR